MATLYIAEYREQVRDQQGLHVLAPKEPSVAEQTVAIGATSTACTNAFSHDTTFVRVHVDAICSITFGTAPVATASMKRMAAGSTEYFGVPPGASLKIAVITNT